MPMSSFSDGVVLYDIIKICNRNDFCRSSTLAAEKEKGVYYGSICQWLLI